MESYGTGSVVKLPGAASEQPNVYEFGTTYEHMYQDLLRKDPMLYPLIKRHPNYIYLGSLSRVGRECVGNFITCTSVLLPLCRSAEVSRATEAVGVDLQSHTVFIS